MDFPCSQLIAAGTAECQMIEPRPALVERLSAAQIRELCEADDCAARKQATRWNGPLSSSRIGSEPNRALYQGTLRRGSLPLAPRE